MIIGMIFVLLQFQQQTNYNLQQINKKNEPTRIKNKQTLGFRKDCLKVKFRCKLIIQYLIIKDSQVVKMAEQQNNKLSVFSWFEEPQEIELIDSFQQIQNPYARDIEINKAQSGVENQNRWDETMRDENQSESSPRNGKQQTTTNVQEILFQTKGEKSYKRDLSQPDDSKVSKEQRIDKQHLYSKAYRERKKEQYKTIEQENNYLKKRIQQLENQIREQQIELNRLKFLPPEKELTVEELRKYFLQKTVDIFVQSRVSPTQQLKVVYSPKDPFYHEFLDIYAENGFAGTKKFKLLNYYFNQILEGILKDSERYLSLMFAKSQSYQKLEPLPQFQPLNNAFQNIFKPNEDLKERLKYFAKNLYPLHLELNKYCSDFYNSFQNILNCSQKIHNFIRDTYLYNMDVARKRIQLETWFEFHKYGKLMRKLRFMWLDYLRSGTDDAQSEIKRNVKGSKKKKGNTDEDYSR